MIYPQHVQAYLKCRQYGQNRYERFQLRSLLGIYIYIQLRSTVCLLWNWVAGKKVKVANFTFWVLNIYFVMKGLPNFIHCYLCFGVLVSLSRSMCNERCFLLRHLVGLAWLTCISTSTKITSTEQNKRNVWQRSFNSHEVCFYQST